MGELFERNEKIDRVTLANELTRQGQLQSVDGLSYLVSLDDGLPVIHNLADYIEIVREKARVRRIAALAVDVRSRALSGDHLRHWCNRRNKPCSTWRIVAARLGQ